MIGYVSLGITDDPRAALPRRGARIPPVEEVPAKGLACSRHPGSRQELCIRWPFDGGPAGAGNMAMVALPAPDEATVRACHAPALEAGGPRPPYGGFSAGQVRDPDGARLRVYRGAA